MRKVNPFKPTAGAEPPVLAGREDYGLQCNNA